MSALPKQLAIWVLALLIILLPVQVIAQSSSYTMFFQPGVQITKFTSTLTVPKISTGTGLHAVWPGLENLKNDFVYQNVIADLTPGQWQFFVEYCCNPNVEYPAMNVQPGDKIVSTMSYNTVSQLWTNTWSIAGSTVQGASYSDTFAGQTLNKALLAVELQNGANWDFGQIQWSNVEVTAATSSTAWCGTAFTTSGSYGFTVSGTSFSVSGNSVTCTYANVLFSGPK